MHGFALCQELRCHQPTLLRREMEGVCRHGVGGEGRSRGSQTARVMSYRQWKAFREAPGTNYPGDETSSQSLGSTAEGQPLLKSWGLPDWPLGLQQRGVIRQSPPQPATPPDPPAGSLPGIREQFRWAWNSLGSIQKSSFRGCGFPLPTSPFTTAFLLPHGRGASSSPILNLQRLA